MLLCEVFPGDSPTNAVLCVQVFRVDQRSTGSSGAIVFYVSPHRGLVDLCSSVLHLGFFISIRSCTQDVIVDVLRRFKMFQFMFFTTL